MNTDDSYKHSSSYFVPGFLKMRKNQYLVTFILIVIGALLGYLASLFIKPVFEAESRLITNMELVEDANINEIMVDSQLELVRELLYHRDIVDSVIETETSAGNPIDLAYLKDHTTLERRLMTTLIQVRSGDPLIAQRIANTWVKQAFDRLTAAYDHALLVSEAKWLLTSIENCQKDQAVQETNFCMTLDVNEVNKLTEQAQEVITVESPYALGLTKDLQISQYQEAPLPSKPIHANRSNLILVGALLGLVLSLILLETPILYKKDQA